MSNGLSYHPVREAIAGSIIRFHYVRSEENHADILTKALDFITTWSHVEPMLFWKGDTVVPQSSPLYVGASGPTDQALRGVTNGSAPSLYDVSAPAVVTKTKTNTNSAGVQARAYDIYTYLNTLQVQIPVDSENTYGKPANTNSNLIPILTRRLAGSPKTS